MMAVSKISTLIALSLASTLSWAATVVPENVTIVKKPTEVIFESSSSYNRMGKKFQLTGQPIGFTVAPIPAVGVNAAVFLDKDSLIQLEYSSGTADDSIFSYRKVTADVVGLRYKQFVSNSFYINTGVNYRKIDLKANGSYFWIDPDGYERGSAESITAGLSIGNQWQFESFTIGCDWVGIDWALSKLKSSYTSSGYTDETSKKRKDDWDKLARGETVQLVRLYLGASF